MVWPSRTGKPEQREQHRKGKRHPSASRKFTARSFVCKHPRSGGALSSGQASGLPAFRRPIPSVQRWCSRESVRYRWRPAESQYFSLTEESIRMPVEAAVSEQGSRWQKETATRGEFIPQEGHRFRLQADVSPAEPPPQEAAAAPHVRVRPRGWAKPLAQGAQCRPGMGQAFEPS